MTQKLVRGLALAGAFLFLFATGRAEAETEKTPFSASDVNHGLRHALDRVSSCYKRHALPQRRATGAFSVTFVVDKNGRVARKTLRVRAPGVRGRRLSRCIKRLVSPARFRATGVPTTVTVPFVLQRTRTRGAGPVAFAGRARKR